MKNPIDRLTRRWKRKQEEQPAKLQDPRFETAKRTKLPSTRRGARANLFRQYGVNPAWSKARRERNKAKNLRKLARGQRGALPHGRQTRPKVKRHG